MRAQEFLSEVRDRAVARLPVELRDWRSRIVYATLQTHYGNPHVHYEVWLVRKTSRIEIGLHFEADRDANHAWATLLAAHADELREAIGPGVELEEWTPSWTRLHETLPLGPLDNALCDAVAERLAAIVAATGSYLTPRPPSLAGKGVPGR
ncbi:MAG: hypothetical protein ACRDJ9_13700 [Dehalococcoidia bacterium]